jgi:hypothetical protein
MGACPLLLLRGLHSIAEASIRVLTLHLTIDTHDLLIPGLELGRESASLLRTTALDLASSTSAFRHFYFRRIFFRRQSWLFNIEP